MKAARGKTGLEEAVVTGLGRIGGYPVALAVFEFNFLGGSMASVVGEKALYRLLAWLSPSFPIGVDANSNLVFFQRKDNFPIVDEQLRLLAHRALVDAEDAQLADEGHRRLQHQLYYSIPTS